MGIMFQCCSSCTCNDFLKSELSDAPCMCLGTSFQNLEPRNAKPGMKEILNRNCGKLQESFPMTPFIEYLCVCVLPCRKVWWSLVLEKIVETVDMQCGANLK